MLINSTCMYYNIYGNIIPTNYKSVTNYTNITLDPYKPSLIIGYFAPAESTAR